MSILAGIIINFSEENNTLDLIDALRCYGWCCNDNNIISYLPLGDNDKYDWKTEGIDNWNFVSSIIEKKILANEMVGISLTWKGSVIGGEFLFDASGSFLNIGLSINRKLISDSNDTDFKWYIERLTNAFNEKAIKLKNIETSQLD